MWSASQTQTAACAHVGEQHLSQLIESTLKTQLCRLPVPVTSGRLTVCVVCMHQLLDTEMLMSANILCIHTVSGCWHNMRIVRQAYGVLHLQVGGGGAFLVSMLRPFLKHVSKESRRCAELLAQLPSELDVEGMIAATWSVVKEVTVMLTEAY